MKLSLNTAAIVIFASLMVGARAADSQDLLSALLIAAENGDPQAQTELAVKYEHAEGVPKDFQKANQLYCRAAKQGYAEAQFKLGWVYANGRGTPRDDSVAAALIGMAAQQGHAHATKLLSYLRARDETQLPSCLLPDPPPPATAAMPPLDDQENVAAPRGRTEIEKLVDQLAPQYAVDSRLALAVMAVESGFNPSAVSPKKAQGLMQLIPETAERFGVKKVFNPVDNIKGGLAYLRWLLAFFQGDVRLVLAAYNAGERAVEKYRGIPPYAETQEYVRKITGIYKKATHPYQPDIVEASPIMSRIRAAGR